MRSNFNPLALYITQMTYTPQNTIEVNCLLQTFKRTPFVVASSSYNKDNGFLQLIDYKWAVSESTVRELVLRGGCINFTENIVSYYEGGENEE